MGLTREFSSGQLDLLAGVLDGVAAGIWVGGGRGLSVNRWRASRGAEPKSGEAASH
jgi:hypothetical protein